MSLIIKPPQEIGTTKEVEELDLGDLVVEIDDFKVDPSQIPDSKVSSPAGAYMKKFIISEIFSAEGTAKNRKDGTYTFPGNLGGGGSGADKFRDALGKYWTYSDDGKEIIFLNPFVNEETVNVGAANLPVTVHFSNPTLLDDGIWPEYVQNILVTPNLDWIFEKFAKPTFDKAVADFEPILKNFIDVGGWDGDGVLGPTEVADFINSYFYQGNSTSADLGYPGGVVNNMLYVIKQWWAEVMQLNVGDPLAGIKGCETLAKYIYGDENLGPEICAPWIDLNTPFLDHVFNVALPIENRLSEQYQPLIGVKFPFYNMKSEYNFYIQNYEKILKQFKDKSVPNPLTEKILPNIYPFISSFAPQALTGELSDYNKYKSLISLGGIVADFSPNALKITGDILEDNNLKKPPKSSRKYFSTWSHQLGMSLLNDANNTFDILETVGDKYKMVLFPMYHPTILQDYDDQKFMFPMYNELDFSTGKDNIVGDMARQTRLSNNFIKYFIRFAEPEKYNPDVAGGGPGGVLDQVVKNKNFVEVGNKLTVTQDANNHPTTSTEKIINENVQIQLTELEGFLATLNLDDLFQAEESAISNLNLTATIFENAKQYNMDEDVNTLVRQNTTLITVDENDDYAEMNAGKEMQKMLLSVIFVGKLKKMAKQRLRSFKDIMSGKINYSETVMYVVNKRIVDRSTGEAGDTIQSYYFLNTSKVDVLRFIDSQVNYDVKYQYDVEAIVLSLGSSYYYYDPELWTPESSDSASGPIDWTPDESEFEGNGIGGVLGADPVTGMLSAETGGFDYQGVTGVGVVATPGELGVALADPFAVSEALIKINQMFDPEISFDMIFSPDTAIFDGKGVNINNLSVQLKVRSKPNYKLARIQVASARGRVLDKPPIFPDVLITPYKGINSKLLINLNQNIGEYFMKPIFFNANDEEQYQNQLDAQKVSNSENPGELLPIEYKGDDQIGKEGYFEVYRLDKRPQTYMDFQGHLMTELRGYHEMEVGSLETTSVSLRDDIMPNKKYYYTFRAVDVHGHVSNPSAVFEVEMIDDNGTVYMIQKIIELQPPNIKDVSKTAKKYIQIKPAFEQSLMSVDAAGDVDASAFDYGDGTSKPINLGVMPVAVWGKKFKIRITSKSSGKQIDLNVTFNRNEKTTKSLGTFSGDPVLPPDGSFVISQG